MRTFVHVLADLAVEPQSSNCREVAFPYAPQVDGPDGAVHQAIYQVPLATRQTESIDQVVAPARRKYAHPDVFGTAIPRHNAVHHLVHRPVTAASHYPGHASVNSLGSQALRIPASAGGHNRDIGTAFLQGRGKHLGGALCVASPGYRIDNDDPRMLSHVLLDVAQEYGWHVERGHPRAWPHYILGHFQRSV